MCLGSGVAHISNQHLIFAQPPDQLRSPGIRYAWRVHGSRVARLESPAARQWPSLPTPTRATKECDREVAQRSRLNTGNLWERPGLLGHEQLRARPNDPSEPS